MKLRKIISVLLVAVLTLSLAVSCGEEKQQLATPVGIAVSDEGLVTWNAVENATGYSVTVNGTEYTAAGTQYQLTDTSVDSTIAVCATADGYKKSEPAEVTFTAQPVSEHTVAIKAPDNVKSGRKIQLEAYVDGERTDKVEWTVTRGADVVSIDENGVLEAKEVTGDKLVTIVAAAKIDKSARAETVLTVVAKPALTQDMLDAVAKNTVAFEGFVRLDVYENRLGSKGKFNSTHTSQIRTAMNGNDWFAEYLNMSVGVSQRIFCRNVNGTATQVGVNLMNEEQNYTMKDDRGNALSWEDSGFYNSFVGLTVDDFRFNETDWRYEYIVKGESDRTVQHMAAAANPYTLEAQTLELIIEDGEIMGIYSLAADDLNMAQGYITEPRLYAVIDAGENVKVPTIGKYKNYDEYAADSDEYAVLKKLHDAVDNARNAERYNIRITHVQQSNLTSTLNVTEGYEETVTPDKCYFREYDILRQGSSTEERIYRDTQYGYRKINDNLYNSYYGTKVKNGEEETVSFAASRAFTGDFRNAKPSFAFSEAIFTSYAIDETDGSTTYYVDDNMYSVATTFYKGIGNDIALYGIFATKGYVNNVEFKPFVTVSKDGVIAGAGFFYDVSYMYGVMLIEYTDINDADNAVIAPEVSAKIDAIAVRQLPASWEELNIVVTVDNNDVYHKASEYIPEYFENNGTPISGTNAEVPFFGAESCLGDTYGFGMPTYYRPTGSGQSPKRAMLFYYDVPLDIDYTIQSSLDKIDAYLKSLGYIPNVYGEYRHADNNIVIVPVDSSLDLNIYVYTETK